MHLLVQYKCMTEGENFCLQISRGFLKFFPNLKFVEAVGDPAIKGNEVSQVLESKSNLCVFGYENKYSCEYSEEDIVDVMN